MKILKYSRQRCCIEDFLKTRYDHPTADIIYQHVRKEYPNISLGTVYRNLSLLVSIGKAQIINCGDGIEHYDYDTSLHYHFRCMTCGCIKDIPIMPMPELNNIVAIESNFYITGHSLVFYGYCTTCNSPIDT